MRATGGAEKPNAHSLESLVERCYECLPFSDDGFAFRENGITHLSQFRCEFRHRTKNVLTLLRYDGESLGFLKNLDLSGEYLPVFWRQGVD